MESLKPQSKQLAVVRGKLLRTSSQSASMVDGLRGVRLNRRRRWFLHLRAGGSAPKAG